MKYDVVHYCPILPCFHVEETFDTLEEANKFAEIQMKYKRLQICCQYYTVPRD